MAYIVVSIFSIIFIGLFFIFTTKSYTDKEFITRLIILIILILTFVFFQLKYNLKPNKINHRIEEIKAECQAKIEYENSTKK